MAIEIDKKVEKETLEFLLDNAKRKYVEERLTERLLVRKAMLDKGFENMVGMQQQKVKVAGEWLEFLLEVSKE